MSDVLKYNLQQVPSPCYVLIEELLLQNLQTLNYIQREAGIKIICALKGFSMWSVFPHVKQYLSGATASSLNEAMLIHDSMNCKVHSYCPVYMPEDIEQIATLSSHLTFNSMSEYHRYINLIKTKYQSVSCGIRINPEYSEIKTDLYNPAIPDSRLGATLPEFSTTLPDGIEGLHFHLLCEQDSHVLERVIQQTEHKFGHLFKQCKWINMGGGHLITKKDYDVEHLIHVLKQFKTRYPQAEIILEPGEAVGWETGFLKSTVLDIIEKETLTIAMLNVSFAAHMPDTLEMPYKPNILQATNTQYGKPVYRLGGVTCLAGDYHGDYSFQNPLKVGDDVIFCDMIHYTMVKTTFFNGVHHPAIGIIDLNNQFRLVKQFTYEDFKNKLS
jgi:carboxynorspermidine decarboxylase